MSFLSNIPIHNPRPTIGPVSGDMSIAPITTAVLSILRPREQINILHIRIHMLKPLKETPDLISVIDLEKLTSSSVKISTMKFFKRSIIFLF